MVKGFYQKCNVSLPLHLVSTRVAVFLKICILSQTSQGRKIKPTSNEAVRTV